MAGTDSAQPRDLLRFATAGSVDDGKSTLVGRLLYDTKSVLADQIEAVERASIDKGLATPDLSLLVDGLRAEREQGITIDVAYRYFGTATREFVLADTPGHVQYTRNTVTGASTAELAVLLVDARNGVVPQTRRHAAVLSLLRVPRLVLAINKIDLIDYDEAKIADIEREFTELARSLGFGDEAVQVIPLSALVGDNVAERGERTPWYEGPTLLEHLEAVPVEGPDAEAPFRLPVQYVIRPRNGAEARSADASLGDLHDYRGYAGQVASGTVRPGDEVVVLPEGHRTTVSEVRTADGPLAAAGAGLSVTVLLADDIDAPRGAMIAAAADPPEITTELDATLCWLAEKPLTPGARLLLKHGTRTTQVIVGALAARLDTEAVSYTDAPDQLEINDIGRVSLRVADPLPVDAYARVRTTGGFVLIDPPTGNTLAAGLVGDPLAAVPGTRPQG
ncbi:MULTISPECIES: sulfate adenylyltransferase subunit 1 [Pseudonocardia]|uniref:sulfate adenylyltransferase n=2 Tax=Pseudonocardia TaxID=1847 RepID=A0A1Y2MYD4_PSEAH|nr:MULTISPECIES: GTP-binding protein [Pseudonocardia]OSY39628.1 Bifunctional enzyme CysN/CysC [Pseudonocardia autotrophica]TDN72759.1 sulfate adenylyltransferase subunit 1 [Pseudonocardia autotrophica]BBG03474.1 sulfate adenylyltransferase subunit 1 [Pseudonocardia autotrophica]GEC24894.1 sulfate adenylyltransferase subunit 1 [Pseudonocardia saturnea]